MGGNANKSPLNYPERKNKPFTTARKKIVCITVLEKSSCLDLEDLHESTGRNC